MGRLCQRCSQARNVFCLTMLRKSVIGMVSRPCGAKLDTSSKTNFSHVIISSFSLILSKTNFSQGKFYEIFTFAAMDSKYSSLDLGLYSVATDLKRLCNSFHFLVDAALTLFPVANSLIQISVFAC